MNRIDLRIRAVQRRKECCKERVQGKGTFESKMMGERNLFAQICRKKQSQGIQGLINQLELTGRGSSREMIGNERRAFAKKSLNAR